MSLLALAAIVTLDRGHDYSSCGAGEVGRGGVGGGVCIFIEWNERPKLD